MTIQDVLMDILGKVDHDCFFTSLSEYHWRREEREREGGRGRERRLSKSFIRTGVNQSGRHTISIWIVFGVHKERDGWYAVTTQWTSSSLHSPKENAFPKLRFLSHSIQWWHITLHFPFFLVQISSFKTFCCLICLYTLFLATMNILYLPLNQHVDSALVSFSALEEHWFCWLHPGNSADEDEMVWWRCLMKFGTLLTLMTLVGSWISNETAGRNNNWSWGKAK